MHRRPGPRGRPSVRQWLLMPFFSLFRVVHNTWNQGDSLSEIGLNELLGSGQPGALQQLRTPGWRAITSNPCDQRQPYEVEEDQWNQKPVSDEQHGAKAFESTHPSGDEQPSQKWQTVENFACSLGILDLHDPVSLKQSVASA